MLALATPVISWGCAHNTHLVSFCLHVNEIFVTSQDHHEISLVKNPAPHFCVLKCQIWLCGIRQYFTFSVYSLWKVSMHGNALVSNLSEHLDLLLSLLSRPWHVDGPRFHSTLCCARVRSITWDLRSACKQIKALEEQLFILSQSHSLILSQTLSVSLPFTLSLLRNAVWLSLTPE